MRARTTKLEPEGGEPSVYDAKRIESCIAAMRCVLEEAEALARRMQEKNIDSFSLIPGAGGASYRRGEAAIRAWVDGLRAALIEAVRNGASR